MVLNRIINRYNRLERTIRASFDAEFYLSSNPDVKKSGVDPVRHYIKHGWLEGRDPTPTFKTTLYLLLNSDVQRSRMNPFYHYVAFGKKEGRSGGEENSIENYYSRVRAPHILQDITFPLEAERAEAILVVVVPEHNTMSGGIYSMFSIAKSAYGLRHKHDYNVLIMTRPNDNNLTYHRQRNFRNYEDVFRFEQIVRCRNAKKVYLHIPEYTAPNFVSSLNGDVLAYLRSRNDLYINILNQNIALMPEREEIADVRALATDLTQSVAHHAYFGQEFADRYDLPTLLLPAYTDLSGYEPIEFEEKEKLIIYSPDNFPHRQPVLKALEKGLPDYRLVEIRNMTFDKFMDLATLCRFSITFGEGFDGYVAQPVYQKGIGFAVYNEEFFPSPDFKSFDNIFVDESDMIENIVSRIRKFEADPKYYRGVNKRMMQIYESLYSKEDYLRRVAMLINRDFELAPRGRLRGVIGMRL